MGRLSFGLRWFVLLLLAEIALFFLIYYLRGSEENSAVERPPGFSRVQALNLQSLINAKGYPCPQAPSLHYAQKQSRGVVIVADCRLPTGGVERYEIDFKGRVRKL